MIQKLRRKFIAVIMSVVSILLLAVFIILIITTQSSMEQDSREVLNKALTGKNHKMDTEKPPDPEDGQPEGENGGKKYSNARIPVMTFSLSQNGTVLAKNGAEFLVEEYSQEDLQALIHVALEQEAEFGVLSAYHFRYAKKATETGYVLVLADTSRSVATMTKLVQSSLLIGASTLLLFFIVSIFIARWAVRPVETAWQQQKQFVGDASHELKTPLTVILSNADMILQNPNKPEPRWVENIKIEAVRMKKLTEELLSLARSEDTISHYVFSHVDFSFLVTDSVLLFEPTIFENDKTLDYDIMEGVFVTGDENELQKLLGILLDNAIGYSAPLSTVKVALYTLGKQVRLTVTNTGPVIPPEELPHLFDRFYRGDPARSGRGGHGLGLSIAQNIVSCHKGKIWVESENNTTIFTVSLPGLKGTEGS